MKIFSLEYTGYKFDEQSNLGDDIQSIAAERLLPEISGHISREALNEVIDPSIVSLNGFFMGSNNWPPSNAVVPILFAFHIAKKYEKVICSPAGIEYLKKFEPVGCRDQGTVSILEKYGVKAYYSKCLTLTLDKRNTAPKNGKVCIVGVNSKLEKIIPASLKKDAMLVNQSKVQIPFLPTSIKQGIAHHLLEWYKNNASLVITSKIHCAMPCIAMGIPVVFLYDKRKTDDYRVHIIKDLIGINYINESLLFSKFTCNYFSKKINWQPSILDIESEKVKIKTEFQQAFARARLKYDELTR